MHKLTRATKLKLLIPITYLVLSLLLFITTWPEQITPHHVAGVIVTLAAFTGWLTARVQLGNAFSIAPKSKFIVDTGIYSKLRHPVYYFSILTCTGLCIYAWQRPLILVLLLLITVELTRIQKEEALLLRTFGKSYTDHKAKTWF